MGIGKFINYVEKEIKQIFEAINSNEDWLRYRNCAIVALMLDSGLRQSETVSVYWCDLQEDIRLLKVCGKGNKERYVPLGELTMRYIELYEQYCPFRKQYMFCTTGGQQLTKNAVKLLIDRIALKLPFEFGSHRLRHNFATNYCLDQYDQHGTVDIYKLMTLMGHADVATTRRYLHLANQIIAVRSNISHLDRVFSPDPTPNPENQSFQSGLSKKVKTHSV